VEYIKPKAYSGYKVPFKALTVIKKQHYDIVKGVSIGGDQPKELLQIYDYPLYLKKSYYYTFSKMLERYLFLFCFSWSTRYSQNL